MTHTILLIVVAAAFTISVCVLGWFEPDDDWLSPWGQQ